jgi:hypothetical protein
MEKAQGVHIGLKSYITNLVIRDPNPPRLWTAVGDSAPNRWAQDKAELADPSWGSSQVHWLSVWVADVVA